MVGTCTIPILLHYRPRTVMKVPAAPRAQSTWQPIQLVAAVATGLAACVPLAGVTLVRRDIGTDDWWPWAVALCIVSAAYLGACSLDHWARSRHALPITSAEPWLSLLMLVLAWFVLARGASSRMLLVGLGPAVAALTAASCVTLLVHLRERLVLARPTAQRAGGWTLSAWRCALAALVLLGVMFLESRPLPTVKPWEKAAGAASLQP